ncbi:TetR/AcrR family transcriptional regulator [Promicromonospora sukumoe]|uniref:TetR/AcrR family transcriptional regulator n=1 Tax=Promicromonospora sukumoe TaxID=88382 RepID=UPI00035D387E|nr:TetR/AcrR family transcriptional regulator [Promicromonospora sukumoe]
MPRIKGATFQAHHEQVWTDLTAAMGALLAERGYDGFNLGHVAARAGIARNTIYNYAKDKTALAAKVAQHASRDTLARIDEIAAGPEPAPRRLAQIVDTLMRSFDTPAVRLMLHSPATAVPQDVLEHPEGPFAQVAAAVERVLGEGVTEGTFRPVGDVVLTTHLLSGVVRAGAERTAAGADIEQVLPAVTDLLLAALLSPRAAPR